MEILGNDGLYKLTETEFVVCVTSLRRLRQAFTYEMVAIRSTGHDSHSFRQRALENKYNINNGDNDMSGPLLGPHTLLVSLVTHLLGT